MPELPEVETIVRALRVQVEGARCVQAFIHDANVSRPDAPASLAEALRGRTITALERRAKFIVMHLDDARILLVHLRMTGQFILTQSEERLRHERARLVLDIPTQLAFIDQRRFGRWRVLTPEEWEAYQDAHLGPEPLACDERDLAAHLVARAAGRRRAVKPFLLDPAVVVGIGNIYAMEALHDAGVSPARPAGDVTASEWRALAGYIQQQLAAGIARGGSSVGEYRRPDGSKGQMQEYLRVYARAGEDCRQCGTPLVSAVIGGRTSVWCAHCQR